MGKRTRHSWAKGYSSLMPPVETLFITSQQMPEDLQCRRIICNMEKDIRLGDVMNHVSTSGKFAKDKKPPGRATLIA